MCLKAKHVDIKALNVETVTNRLRTEIVIIQNTGCFQFSIAVHCFFKYGHKLGAGQTVLKVETCD